MDKNYVELLKKLPFLSYISYGDSEYIGIIQNIDDTIATIYDYGMLSTLEQKSKFLELGEQYWFESNRLVPINIFLRCEWAIFRCVLKTFNAKDVTVIYGPHLNLKDLTKRCKKKSIMLVKHIK